MKTIASIMILSIISILQVNSQEYKNYNHSLSFLIDSLHVQEDLLYIIIDKSDYTLAISVDSTILKEYPVVLGGNPVDDKLREGDQCTPEGSFKMISKYPHRHWSKFIWIDYPNNDSWEKHRIAKEQGIIPENSKIGGEIGIHGVPNHSDDLIDSGTNWTLGCISLKNSDIIEIYPYISSSTVINIQK